MIEYSFCGPICHIHLGFSVSLGALVEVNVPINSVEESDMELGSSFITVDPNLIEHPTVQYYSNDLGVRNQ